MDKIEWSDQYKVGDQDIDLQHERLFSIFNRLAEGLDDKNALSEMDAVFTQLMGYVKNHFRTEERLMKKVGYPNLKAHKEKHEKINAKLKKIQKEFRAAKGKKRQAQAEGVATFLGNWLQEHIKGEDQQYTPFLPTGFKRGRGIGIAIGAAPRSLFQEFLWSDAYTIGHGDIDDQHKRLFTIFNNLVRAINQGEAVLGVEKTFLQLRGYARNHFRYEEKLMRQNGYPDLKAHKKGHDKICDDMRHYRKRFNRATDDQEKSVVAGEVAVYFSHWLQGHIQSVDRKYAPYVTG